MEDNTPNNFESTNQPEQPPAAPTPPLTPPIQNPITPSPKKLPIIIASSVAGIVLIAATVLFIGRDTFFGNTNNSNNPTNTNDSPQQDQDKNTTTLPTISETVIYDTDNLTVTAKSLEKDDYGNVIIKCTVTNNASFRIPGFGVLQIIIDGYQRSFGIDYVNSHLTKYSGSGKPSMTTDDIQPGVTEDCFFYLISFTVDSTIIDWGLSRAQTIRFYMGYQESELNDVILDRQITKEIRTSNYTNGEVNHMSSDFTKVISSDEYDIYALAYNQDQGAWGTYQYVDLILDNKSDKELRLIIDDITADGERVSEYGMTTSLPNLKTRLTAGGVSSGDPAKSISFSITINDQLVKTMTLDTKSNPLE